MEELKKIRKHIVENTFAFINEHERELEKSNNAMLGQSAGEEAKKSTKKNEKGPKKAPTQTTPLVSEAEARKSEDYRKRFQERLEYLRSLRGDRKLSDSDFAKREKSTKKRDKKKCKAAKELVADDTTATTKKPKTTEAASKTILFNKIEFEGGAAEETIKSKRRKSPLVLPKNPKQALEKLAAMKAKKASLPEEAKAQVAETEGWSKAIQRAQGVRIRDDESRLKRALDRKAREKKQREVGWKKRVKSVAKEQEKRQEKRRANIEARKEQKKNKNKKKSFNKKRK